MLDFEIDHGAMVTIHEHRLGYDLDDFVEVPNRVFRGVENYVPPLEMDVRGRLTPTKNPFFEHAQGAIFTARKNGQLVGRVSVQIDHDHLRIHKDATGFFGFLDTVDDPEVVKALLDQAERWLAQRGMKHIRGPISLSMNEEVGTLVEGFDTPPMIMTPFSMPYQGALIEQAGFAKKRDLFAWKYTAGDLPERALKAWREITAMPEVRIRDVDLSRMEHELHTILEIFNDAWSDNWGFVPTTEAETKKAAKDFKLILDPHLTYIIEVEGKPVAFCVIVPNLNEVIADMHGKLFPLNIFKLIYRLKIKRPKAARLMLLGIKKEARQKKRYAGLSAAIYVEAHRRGTARGYHEGELSWTLEDNAPINLGIRSMGGKVYKKFRVYEKPIREEWVSAYPS